MEKDDEKIKENWRGPIECPICHKQKFYINFFIRAYKCFHVGKYHKELKGIGLSNLPALFGFRSIQQLKNHVDTYSPSKKHKQVKKIKSNLTVKKAVENKHLRNTELVKTAVNFCKRKWIKPEYWDYLYLDFDNMGNFRLFVEIYDHSDRAKSKNGGKPLYSGYQARILNGGGVKDVTPGIRNLEIVYNIENVNYDTAIVCESVFDTFIDRSKIVSVFGHCIGDVQFEILKNKYTNLIFCFDSDALEDAKKYAKKAVDELGQQNGWWLNLTYDENNEEQELDDVKIDLMNQPIINGQDYNEIKLIKEFY